MGAWGTGSFENDAALDWMWELEEKGVAAIREAFSMLDGPDIVLEGEDLIAAAEAVAAAFGRPGDLSDETVKAIENHRAAIAIDPRLRALALKAVRRVRDGSDLAERWRGSDDYDEWATSLANLETRLS